MRSVRYYPWSFDPSVSAWKIDSSQHLRTFRPIGQDWIESGACSGQSPVAGNCHDNAASDGRSARVSSEWQSRGAHCGCCRGRASNTEHRCPNDSCREVLDRLRISRQIGADTRDAERELAQCYGFSLTPNTSWSVVLASQVGLSDGPGVAGWPIEGPSDDCPEVCVPVKSTWTCPDGRVHTLQCHEYCVFWVKSSAADIRTNSYCFWGASRLVDRCTSPCRNLGNGASGAPGGGPSQPLPTPTIGSYGAGSEPHAHPSTSSTLVSGQALGSPERVGDVSEQDPPPRGGVALGPVVGPIPPIPEPSGPGGPLLQGPVRDPHDIRKGLVVQGPRGAWAIAPSLPPLVDYPGDVGVGRGDLGRQMVADLLASSQRVFPVFGNNPYAGLSHKHISVDYEIPNSPALLGMFWSEGSFYTEPMPAVVGRQWQAVEDLTPAQGLRAKWEALTPLVTIGPRDAYVARSMLHDMTSLGVAGRADIGLVGVQNLLRAGHEDLFWFMVDALSFGAGRGSQLISHGEHLYQYYKSIGLSPKQAEYWLLHDAGGMGHHFVQRHWGVIPGLNFGSGPLADIHLIPQWLVENPLNIMGRNLSRGEFAYRHFMGDPMAWGGRFPNKKAGALQIGGSWSGKRLGWIKPESDLIRLWYAAPDWARFAGAGAGGAGTLWAWDHWIGVYPGLDVMR